MYIYTGMLLISKSYVVGKNKFIFHSMLQYERRFCNEVISFVSNYQKILSASLFSPLTLILQHL